MSVMFILVGLFCCAIVVNGAVIEVPSGYSDTSASGYLDTASVAKETNDKDHKAYIVNGNNSDPGEYPWLVVLFYQGEFICGGSIIDENTILTAAHCVELDVNQRSGRFHILAGEHKTLQKEESEQKRNVVKVIMNKSYSVVHKYDQDIAVLKLSEPLELNDRVQSISLANKRAEQKLLSESSKCFVAGVGDIDDDQNSPLIVQEIQISLRPRTYCSTEVRNRYEKKFTKHMLCSYRDNEGPCSGDSGGPLTCLNAEKKHVQVGIVSWGSKLCFNGFNVYARVSTLKSWIKRQNS